MMRLLVSVRSVVEALVAARGGADFIDLKEPGQGALGGLPPATIRRIVAALRTQGMTLPVSATIGDVPMSMRDEILARVDTVGDCGVDYVKVGIERGPMSRDVLDALAASGRAIVPVFIADQGLDETLVSHALTLGFAGLMTDTADKHAGSLFEVVDRAALHRFIAQVRAAGTMVGIAGALRLSQAAELAALAPDFAGFRSAVCAGDRSAALDPQRLLQLVQAMRDAQTPLVRASPSSSDRMRASSAR